MNEFKRGDRVRRPTPDPSARRKSALGTYIGLSRDGQCDRVHWDGTSKTQSIVRGYICLEPPQADGAVDPAGESDHDWSTREKLSS